VTEHERIDQEIQKRHDWITAIHEAGHALGCRLAGCPVVKATIEPKRDWDGHVQHTVLVSFEQGALISLVGRAAEVEFSVPDNWGYDADYAHAEKDIKASIRLAKCEAWSKRTGIWSRLNGRKVAVAHRWDVCPRVSYEGGKLADHVADWKRSVRVKPGEWKAEFDRLRRKARRLARKRRDWIERIAKLLAEKRTLTDEEIPQLCD
jgi:hypothetical protein